MQWSGIMQWNIIEQYEQNGTIACRMWMNLPLKRAILFVLFYSANMWRRRHLSAAKKEITS